MAEVNSVESRLGDQIGSQKSGVKVHLKMYEGIAYSFLIN